MVLKIAYRCDCEIDFADFCPADVLRRRQHIAVCCKLQNLGIPRTYCYDVMVVGENLPNGPFPKELNTLQAHSPLGFLCVMIENLSGAQVN